MTHGLGLRLKINNAKQERQDRHGRQKENGKDNDWDLSKKKKRKKGQQKDAS